MNGAVSEAFSRLTTIRSDIRSALVSCGVGTASEHNFKDFASDIYSVAGKLNVGELGSLIDGTITCVAEQDAIAIRPYTFYSCTNLVSVSIPNATTIGSSAFVGCTSLRTVYAPNVTSIASYAFSGCSNVDITLGYSYWSAYNPSYIGYVFSNMSDFSLDLPQCVSVYSAGISEICGFTANNCLTIYGAAFSGSKLVSASFENCETVNTYAFYRCYSLTSINLKNCKNIGNSAFNGCTSLSELYLPNCEVLGSSVFLNTNDLSVTLGIQSLGSSNDYLYNQFNGGTVVLTALSCTHQYMFGGSYFPSNIYLNQVSTIVDNALYNTSKIKYVSAPVCTEIGAEAMCNDYNLTSIYAPLCETIGDGAFSNCSSLSIVSFPACKDVGNFAFFNAGVTTISLPECLAINDSAFINVKITELNLKKCTGIGSCAFRSCYSLSTVSIPNCEEIRYSAFNACSSLTSVYAPKCKIIGSFAFAAASSLSNISSAFNTCEEIYQGAFMGTSISYINLPNCKTLHSNALYLCSYLTTAILPSCTILESYAFYGDSKLTSVSIPACETIGSQAFMGCSALSSIVLEKCYTISSRAFANCYELGSIYIKYSNAVINLYDSAVFSSAGITQFSGAIYVPSNLVSNYKTAPWWSYFSRIIQTLP